MTTQRTSDADAKQGPIEIAGATIAPGESRVCEVRLPRLYTQADLGMPIHVFRGASAGPVLLVCGAIHGDEINGIEIIRRVVDQIEPEQLGGTLIAVPIVNIYGFISQSQYLPGNTDLNRAFPGGKDGPFASRVAYLFTNEIVRHCTHCIDLHTATRNRTHLPQVSGDLGDPETRKCAIVFGASVFRQHDPDNGSLRHAAAKHGIHTIVYEAGEAQRFGRRSIDVGANGVLRVMTTLKMISGLKLKKRRVPTQEVESSQWIRADESGILHLDVELGVLVSRGQQLGFISDPMGGGKIPVKTTMDGLVIGHTRNPLVHRGDAIVNVASAKPSVYL
jgi:hypothetical protein